MPKVEREGDGQWWWRRGSRRLAARSAARVSLGDAGAAAVPREGLQKKRTLGTVIVFIEGGFCCEAIGRDSDTFFYFFTYPKQDKEAVGVALSVVELTYS
jgi:hypothetical protein